MLCSGYVVNEDSKVYDKIVHLKLKPADKKNNQAYSGVK
jgi:hypothetical protein